MAQWGGRAVLSAVLEDDTSGDRTLLAVDSDKQVRIFRVSYTPDSDVTADVQIEVGSTPIHRVSNPKAGMEYGLNLTPHFILGALGEDVIVNFVGDTTNAQMNLLYELI